MTADPSTAEMLRIPYLISDDVMTTLISGGADTLSAFLEKHVNFIDRAWQSHGDAALVALAASSLISQVRDRIPACVPLARLYILEAEALIAAAAGHESIVLAHRRAEEAREILTRADTSTYSFELLSESILIAGVALKALGQFDDCISYLRSKAREGELTELQSVALVRQEVMMFQDETRHLLLLNDAARYRKARAREYFRTLKRATEILLNNRRVAIADALAPELGRAYIYARSELSFLGRLSFYRDIAQLYAVRGERLRALRLLHVCLRLAQRSHYAGQARQISLLMRVLSDDGAAAPRLETFRIAPPAMS